MLGVRRFEQLSWHWKLPLLVAGLSVMTVTAFGFVSYRQMRASQLHAMQTRMRSALGEISAIVSLGTVNQLETLSRFSDNANMRRALARPGPVDTTTIALLTALMGRTGTVASVELRDAHGQVRHRLGSTLDEAATFDDAAGRTVPAISTKAAIGPIFNHDTSLYFWSSAPIREGRRHVGEVRLARRIGGSANSRIVTRLLGNKAALVLGNHGGPFWKEGRQVALVLRDTLPRDSTLSRYVRGDTTWMAVSTAFVGTPWRYAIEFSERDAIAPVRSLVSTFVLSGFVIAVLAGVLGLLVSRSITSPLRELTEATEHIARGDLRVSLRASARKDEIGRLARAFTVMTQQVRDIVSRLEADVDARAGELETAEVRLHRLDESLRQNVHLATLGRAYASVGHELRNPLGVMSNVVVLLDALPEASPKLTGYARMLREQIRLSERIVSELLDRTRAGSRGDTAVDLAALIEETLARAAPPLTICVAREIDPLVPPIVVDRDQIGQVIWNLVTNAVQAMGHAGGTLTMSLRLVASRVQLAVRDSGPGVAAGDVDRLFDPLFTRKADGVGLGLAISRDFARANGGDLTLQPSAEGACFVLDLPLRGAARPDAQLPGSLRTAAVSPGVVSDSTSS